MIRFMTGTPGSGKSHSMAMKIREKLRHGRNVISTVDIDINRVTRNGKLWIGDFQYIPIYDLDVEYLYRYAVKNHQKGKESQTLVFIDECQLIFNSRDYSLGNRKPWIEFFTRHRHLGYDVYLITQNDRYIDRQVRALVEYEVKHRKINNYLWFLPVTIFVAVETWYGHTQKIKIRSEFILFRRSVAKLYDSYTMFDEFAKKYTDTSDGEADGHFIAETVDTTANEEGQDGVADLVDPEAGGRGTRRRGGRGGHVKTAFVRLRNWFTAPLVAAKLKKAGAKT